MNIITDAIAGLFDVGGLLGFIAGIVIGRCWYWICDRVNDWRHPEEGKHRTGFRSLTMMWALLFIIMGFIGFQQRAQANTIRSLRGNVEACQREFQQAQIYRDQVKADNDDVDKEDRIARIEWLKAIILPPLNIAQLHTTDPRFQQYTIDISREYFNRMNNIDQRRQSNQKKLAEHPLPKAKCGVDD